MKVELLDSMGNDLAVINAARVSLGNESREMGSRERGLMNYLMREHHGTPFEMVDFKFRVHVPIGVSREWMRHRDSYNEISTRYVEMEPTFYFPENENVRTQVGKPGHYTFETMNHGDASDALGMMNLAYQTAWKQYTAMLKLGVAKEVARNVLPLGIYTQFIWKVNLRSLLNFLKLRLGPTALLEIRQCAQMVFDLIEPIAPATITAWEAWSRPGGEELHTCDACDYHDA